jgi:hypothetical protein
MNADNSRDRILCQLDEVRALRPELRFGQLVAAVGALAEDETGRSLWDLDDVDFAAALDRFAADLARSGKDRGELLPAGVAAPSQPPLRAS